MLGKFKKSGNLKFLFYGLIFSLSLINFTANLKIINPNYTGWLQVGDGISELSWEFFRRQPILQFPLGLNPEYGLEISSTMVFDGQIPILSLFFHPFSEILPIRFQYFGLFLFFTFLLNFFFATKIFSLFKFTTLQVVLNSIILSISPVILNRYIENTHYALTSAWLIFWAIYLSLQKKEKFFSWLILFNLIVLIHFYYILFALVIYVLNSIIKNGLNFKYQIKSLIKFSLIVISTLLTMYISGYFYGGVESQDVGYGFFRSTLTSLIDPNTWSLTIVDISETEGSYEGFSYVGLSTLVLSILWIFLIFRKRNYYNADIKFLAVGLSSLLLFIFSLSNKIAFATTEIFEYTVPYFFERFTNTFRSTGRYSWLLVFVIFIWISIQLRKKLNSILYSFVLFSALIIQIIDSGNHMLSQKNNKFTSEYRTNLKSKAWFELNECYKNLRIYPPSPEGDNLFNFMKIAYNQDLGINIARLGRINQNTLKKSFADIHDQFKFGNYNKDDFYIFSSSKFVPKEVIEYQTNLALKTIDSNSGWGILDGFVFIAPNLKSCSGSINLKKVSKSFGPLPNFIYNGELINFKLGESTDNFVLTGFSQFFDWGILTNMSDSNITLHLSENLEPRNMKIYGMNKTKNSDESYFNIIINSEIEKICKFKNEENYCEIDISDLKLINRVLNISFIPLNENMNLSEPLLGLTKLQIS